MNEKKEKKRKGRYSYLNDFKLNEQNEYEYRGNVYAVDLPGEQKKKLLRSVLFLLAECAGLILLAGIVPFEGLMNTFYVIIPYITEIGFAGFLISAVGTVYRNDELREYVYQKSAGRLGVYGPGLLGTSIVRLAASLLYLLINGIGKPLSAAIYFLITLLLIVLEIKAVQSVMALKYRLFREKKTENQ